jgi:hypothetical protein
MSTTIRRPRPLFRSLAVLVLALAGGTATGGEVRLNQIQVIGSHNSYHIAPAPAMLSLVAATRPNSARSLEYTHRPLGEQFGAQGVRQIELDVFADPQGGLYAEPKLRTTLLKMGKDPGPDPDAGGVLRKPGMKVLHIPDLDYRTTAATFVDALRQVRAWSKANPRHVPIFVLVELKDEATPGLTRPTPFDRAQLDAVDAEIRSVFAPAEMIAPDDVRAGFATLPEALAARGWPALESVRGRVMFALDNEGRLRDHYLDGHPALKGRVMFASVPQGDPAAAWMKVNDVVQDFDKIRSLVKAGYLVRTRADANTTEARANDPSRRDQALASGAQFVSTDYPEPNPAFSPYRVQLPGGVVARANPVSGDPALAGRDLEREGP